MWHLPTLLDQVTDALRGRAEALRIEQAVRGIDHLDELALQELLGASLAQHHRVTREAYYPSSVGKRSRRARCDFVLTPRGRSLDTSDSRADLALEARCAPEDALWLELKVAHQLLPPGRRNPRYGTQWRSAIIADLRKMKLDPRIRHAALALVVFTDNSETLTEDVRRFEALLDDERPLFGFRCERSFAIEERIGHTVCGVVVWPLL